MTYSGVGRVVPSMVVVKTNASSQNATWLSLRANQTISREDALIAHTRNNAYLFFRENDLGSIQPGRYADMVVIDRDYLTIPADQIKDIKPVMTLVGGRVVFDAAKE